MNNFENKALYQRVLEFSQNDNSVAGEAAKKLAMTLQQQIKNKQFISDNFTDNIISFLTISADRLNELDEDTIKTFFQQCKDNNAVSVIERLIDIYTSTWFGVKLDRITFIGQSLAEKGFSEAGVRCFERAGEMINESADTGK